MSSATTASCDRAEARGAAARSRWNDWPEHYSPPDPATALCEPNRELFRNAQHCQNAATAGEHQTGGYFSQPSSSSVWMASSSSRSRPNSCMLLRSSKHVLYQLLSFPASHRCCFLVCFVVVSEFIRVRVRLSGRPEFVCCFRVRLRRKH